MERWSEEDHIKADEAIRKSREVIQRTLRIQGYVVPVLAGVVILLCATIFIDRCG